MNQKLLKEYSDLKHQAYLLDLQRSQLSEKILAEFKKNDVEKIKDEELGTFSIGRRSTWKYTPAVESLEEKVKLAKNREQEKGIAKETVGEHLLYRPVKDFE